MASLSGVLASLMVLLTLIHWKRLHRPHVALFKLILICVTFFLLSTLPWQLNFTGILGGLICGTLLTIALVPFVSIKQYKRKSKVIIISLMLFFFLI